MPRYERARSRLGNRCRYASHEQKQLVCTDYASASFETIRVSSVLSARYGLSPGCQSAARRPHRPVTEDLCRPLSHGTKTTTKVRRLQMLLPVSCQRPGRGFDRQQTGPLRSMGRSLRVQRGGRWTAMVADLARDDVREPVEHPTPCIK